VRPLGEANHYETLEISEDASLEEVDKAYRVLREAYETESLALYSVFSDGDASVMRDNIEEAYRVLSSFALRAEYDAGRVGTNKKETPFDRDPMASEETQGSHLAPLGSAPSRDQEIEEPEDGRWDGAALRRARDHVGLELEDIAEITKVGIRILRQIEEDAFEELPATVYVRGFVTSYARTVGIDPGRVVSTYIQRLEESRSDQGRSGFLGRR
jgi:flagellar biosynthesis protein FlhG